MTTAYSRAMRADRHRQTMITITIVAPRVEPMASPLSASFGPSGGTIGRSPDSTLVLPDADRKISRTHATIIWRDGRFLLRDQGSATSTMINGKAIGHGREAPLASGDELRVGAFTMRVSDAGNVPGGAQPRQQESDGDAGPETIVGTLVSWKSDQPARPRNGITTVFVAGTENRSARSPMPTEPPAPADSAADPLPLSSSSTNASRDALLQALLEGAGLEENTIPGGLTPELMADIGRLLHEGTAGLLDLLAARAAAKRQVRADMTVIAAADNNPLKFSPDLPAALTHLLVPRGKGFMPPVRAVGDAYEDLRTHQKGFMAGMHSALAVVLARFDPKALEQRAAEQSLVDSFLPTARKAKLWDQFGLLCGTVSREAEQDFQTLFGAEFLKAYRRHARPSDSQAAGAGDPNATRLADPNATRLAD